MASKPGLLTDWPWKPLGKFKYVVVAPWVIHSIYSFIIKEGNDRDLSYILLFPLLLWRVLHNQIWISLSRYRTAKGSNRIVDKAIEFEQVDRETNWDDQILFNGLLLYMFRKIFPGGSHVPMWRLDGVVLTILLHAGPVEFLYYWLHRALHHHYLYSRYHSHHHSSIATEPITSVIHPFAEHIAYSLLFAIPLSTIVLTETASMGAVVGYITYIDFMNNMGHCNFELIPMWLFSIIPPLKYIMYTPSFHSLHHTQFRTNYSLFMPLYDFLYGTMDKYSDKLHETSLKREEDSPDVVHLTHLATPESIYHLRLGFASLAAKPSSSLSKWHMWLMWPVTLCSMIITWVYARTFVVERNRFREFKLQTWTILKYNIHYLFQYRQNEMINSLIEEAILEAEKKGAKVISLGLLNQGEKLNCYGGLYVNRHPQLKIRVVDGSSLAAAVVLNSIPKETTQVILRGNLTKVAYAVVLALCQRSIQVVTIHEDEHEKLKKAFAKKCENNLVLSGGYSGQIWLVGDGLTKEEQLKATKGTLFIPFSQFLPKKIRKDCIYHLTPALATPVTLENVDSCENWLPRRVMSAWRIGGIVHALEGWEEHECGYSMSNIDKAWEATLRHGFRPLTIPMQPKF